MPVQFKSTTEYKSHFTPVVPKQSAACTAPPALVDEMIFQDPSNSDKVCPERKVFSECEPPLQRKKRAPAPVTSLSSDFYDTSKPAAEDYILLGNNEKFVDNIRYRNRSSNNCKNLGEFNFNRDVSPPKIQKSCKENLEPKPGPGPVVDTSAFRGAPVTPSTPLTPRDPKDAQTSLQLSQKQQGKSVNDKTVARRVDKNNIKENDDLRKNITRVLQKEKQAASRSQANKTVKRPANPRMKTYVKPWVMSQATRTHAPTETGRVKDKIKLQTENDTQPSKQKVKVMSEDPSKAKVIDAAKEQKASQQPDQADDQGDYSLKYKAGVSRPKRQGPLRRSEYQREFEWKNAVKASPLIDAEQMVYQSRVNSAPSKPDVVPKMSEYRAQFLQYPFVPADYTVPPTPFDKGPKKSASKQIKRSKSVGAIDVSKGEESQSVASPDPKQQIGESVAAKHGKYRKRGKSEYAMNFQPPWKYEYVNGAWKKASPPHIEQEAGQEEAVVPSDPMTSWFGEVMELRQKAAEYRKRAQGTHFSREHLVQLMARQAELWDQLSEGSRTLSALSLEAHASRSQPGPMTADVTEAGDEPDNESEAVSPGSSSVQQTSQKVGKKQGAKTKTTKKNPVTGVPKKLEYSSTDNGSATSQSYRTLSSERDEPDVESEPLSPEPKPAAKARKSGTKTKPKAKSGKLKKEKRKPAEEVKSAWQDDTNDGATSPNQPDEDEGRIPTPTLRQRAVNQPVMRHHLDRTTPSVGGAILTSPTNQRKVYTAPPVFGSGYQSCDEGTSRSSAEEAIYRPASQAESPPKRVFMQGRVGASPTFGRPSEDTHYLRDDSASSDRPLNAQFMDSPLKQNPGNFVPRLAYSDDDDVLSVSARSIASSCSLASEVLERAQRRHDDFWGRRVHQTR